MSRLEKTQTIELSRMDAQPTTTSSRQGSNSSHTSSEHNLIENQLHSSIKVFIVVDYNICYKGLYHNSQPAHFLMKS